MPVSVTMPQLGEGVTEGTVTRWLKSVGDHIHADEPLLEVSTDKVDTEIPAPAGGVLMDILVQEDETVSIGSELAVISGEEDQGPEDQGRENQKEQEPEDQGPEDIAETTPSPSPIDQPDEAISPGSPDVASYVTPLVRKLASDHNLNLDTIVGTGTGGRITRQDVLDEVARRQPEAPLSLPRGRVEKLTRTRAVIARKMVESLRDSAQLTTVVEVDVTRIARMRNKVKDQFAKDHGAPLSFLPFFAVATVEALRAHPKLNARIDLKDGTVTYHDQEHLGIAVDTERGLMVPVIRNAGDLNLAGFARRIKDLAERTRAMTIAPDEISGGTFTLTNTGSRGALFDTPILNQPQVGILGTGIVVKRPIVVDDPALGEVIVPRSMVYLALSYDHRLIDGADAARFLGTIKHRLEKAAFDTDLGL